MNHFDDHIFKLLSERIRAPNYVAELDNVLVDNAEFLRSVRDNVWAFNNGILEGWCTDATGDNLINKLSNYGYYCVLTGDGNLDYIGKLMFNDDFGVDLQMHSDRISVTIDPKKTEQILNDHGIVDKVKILRSLNEVWSKVFYPEDQSTAITGSVSVTIDLGRELVIHRVFKGMRHTYSLDDVYYLQKPNN